MLEEIQSLLARIRNNQPLILNLTNAVTMNFIADGLSSLGASPLMANATEELEELVMLAHALVINLGTLDSSFIQLIQKACQFANSKHKPIILDPVGAGASIIRTQSALHLLESYAIDTVRGNAGEIAALSGAKECTRGVDSQISTQDSLEAGKVISQQFQTTVVMSGKIDTIINRQQIYTCHRGAPMMPLVSGTGCLLSAVIAAFRAVSTDSMQASISACEFYGHCGEQAALKATGPGSFKIHFLDALHLEYS